MPRSVKFSMVADRRKTAAEVLVPPPHRLHLPRPMMIGATLLFWTAVLFGIRLLAS
jgi:hypothetical protein